MDRRSSGQSRRRRRSFRAYRGEYDSSSCRRRRRENSAARRCWLLAPSIVGGAPAGSLSKKTLCGTAPKTNVTVPPTLSATCAGVNVIDGRCVHLRGRSGRSIPGVGGRLRIGIRRRTAGGEARCQDEGSDDATEHDELLQNGCWVYSGVTGAPAHIGADRPHLPQDSRVTESIPVRTDHVFGETKGSPPAGINRGARMYSLKRCAPRAAVSRPATEDSLRCLEKLDSTNW